MPNETTNTPILTLDSDAKLETAQSISDLTWHEIQNAYRTRRILTSRFRFPHGAGVFSCLGVSLKWLSRVLVYIVKNISRSVHDLFTIKGRLRDIL